MGITNKQEAQGNNNVVIAHVFGAPILEADSSKAVTTSASSVTLDVDRLYRIVAEFNTYFYFGLTGGDAATANNSSLLVAEVPEVFRCPAGLPELHLLGTASGTVWVSELDV